MLILLCLGEILLNFWNFFAKFNLTWSSFKYISPEKLGYDWEFVRVYEIIFIYSHFLFAYFYLLIFEVRFRGLKRKKKRIDGRVHHLSHVRYLNFPNLPELLQHGLRFWANWRERTLELISSIHVTRIPSVFRVFNFKNIYIKKTIDLCFEVVMGCFMFYFCFQVVADFRTRSFDFWVSCILFFLWYKFIKFRVDVDNFWTGN